MDDIEFVCGVDTDLGELYFQAKKNHSLGSAGYSLVLFRAIADLVCNKLAKLKGHDFNSDGICGRINELENKRHVNGAVIHLLHDIRLAGNKGAHPEEHKLSSDDLGNLALSTAKLVCELVEQYIYQNPGGKVPQYNFVSNAINLDDGLKGLCYRSVIEGDAESQYELGLYLLEKSRDEYDSLAEGESIYIDISPARALSKQAYHYISLASDSEYPAAIYKVGMAMIAGENMEKNVAGGEHMVWRASELSNIDAMAYLGWLYLEGSEYFVPDPKEGISLLKKAAAQDSPYALTVLGELYFVKGDHANALRFFIHAAEAGFGHAQIRYSEHLISNQEYEKARVWLKQALDQGFSIANLYIARTLKAEGGSQNLAAASALFDEYIKFSEDPSGALEIAGYYFNGDIGAVDILKAARVVVLAYRWSEKPTLVSKKILKLSKKIHKSLKFGLCNRERSEEWLLASLNFDENSIPEADEWAAASKLKRIASESSVSRSPESILKSVGVNTKRPTRVDTKLGRNETCTCGSGKKYKHCCL